MPRETAPKPPLTQELQAKLAAGRRQAAVARQLGIEGPPFEPDPTPTAPFYAELRACIDRLRMAREAAGLSLNDVSTATGLAAETLSRLESGAATNPTWQTLGRYANAVKCKLSLEVKTAG